MLWSFEFIFYLSSVFIQRFFFPAVVVAVFELEMVAWRCWEVVVTRLVLEEKGRGTQTVTMLE